MENWRSNYKSMVESRNKLSRKQKVKGSNREKTQGKRTKQFDHARNAQGGLYFIKHLWCKFVFFHIVVKIQTNLKIRWTGISDYHCCWFVITSIQHCKIFFIRAQYPCQNLCKPTHCNLKTKKFQMVRFHQAQSNCLQENRNRLLDFHLATHDTNYIYFLRWQQKRIANWQVWLHQKISPMIPNRWFQHCMSDVPITETTCYEKTHKRQLNLST